MAQFSRPTADFADGLWTDQSGGTSLFAVLDESVASDSDYIQSSADPSADIVKIKLGTITDPVSSTGHTVRYRIGKTGSGSVNLTARLVQGASTVIAEWDHSDIAIGPTDVAQTLTSGQADAITDYGDLYIEFEAGGVPVVGSFAYFTTADAIHNEATPVAERNVALIDPVEGKLWLGWGDLNLNGGARALISVNPSTGAVTHEVASINTDMYSVLGLANGDLIVPYWDLASGTWPSYAKRIAGSWSTGGSDVLAFHVYDAVEWQGNIYMCGSKFDSASTSAACVWKSTDGGATWTEDLIRGVGSGARRFYQFFPYDDRLYVQYVFLDTVQENGWYITTSNLTWTQDAAARPFSISSTGSRHFNATQFQGRMWVCGSNPGAVDTNTNTGDQTRSPAVLKSVPLDRSTTETVHLSSADIWDFCVDPSGQRMWVLMQDGRLLTSTDGSTFTTLLDVAEMPDDPRSIACHGGYVWIGDSGGRLYRSSPDAYAPPSGDYVTFEAVPSGWTLTDTTGQISFSKSAMVKTQAITGGGWGNPRLVKDTPYTRANGLRMEFRLLHVNEGATNFVIGFTNNTATPAAFDHWAAGIGRGNVSMVRAIPVIGGVGTYNPAGNGLVQETWPGLEYRICVLATGAVIYARGAPLSTPYDDSGTTRGTWLPIGREMLNATANLYAGISLAGQAAFELRLAWMRIYTGDPLSPDVEDTFTRADDATAPGGAWTEIAGNWGITGNAAYTTDTSGTAVMAGIDSGTADGIVECAVSGISASAHAGVIFRSDGTNQNYWRAYYDGVNFKVDKVVGGSVTNVHTAADASTSGVIMVMLGAGRFTINKGAGANTGAVTISDTALQSNDIHGLYALQTAATARFDGFRVWGPMVD